MEFIPLGRPDITEKDIEAVAAVLRTGMLIQGVNTLAFEKAIGDYTGTKEVIAVSNGTATLHLALKVMGVGPGDEVIVPALSYVATANVVELVGATPVFVDIDLATFNINTSLIEAAITPRTKAIIPVHEFGLACDIETVCRIAAKHQLHVIEDAACALGAVQNSKPAGSFGILGSFSLHPRKSITSGEGGFLVTNDAAIATKLRQLRNHGIEMKEGVMHFPEAGFNYRITDFQAALALSQFQRIANILPYKQRLAEIYFNEIKNPRITLPVVPSGHNHTWQTFHVLLADDMDQQKIIQQLKEKNIGTNYGAQCIPAQEYYQHKYGHNSPVTLPQAYRAYKKGLAIPLYERLSEQQILYISQIINQL
ncbi:MAG: DegT/DnrJ/EryC1/StrS family aminotransferase [Chitinophagaceae bacterium]